MASSAVNINALRTSLRSMITEKGCHPIMMRFAPEKDWDANKGLAIARDLLAPIREEFPTVSHGDMWTLAGVVAVEAAGGPDVAWRAGRTDRCPAAAKAEAADHEELADETLPDGRLPDAKLGAEHLRDVFGRMGFGDRDIVALSGAHTLGRCHGDRSGFVGPWTEKPLVFDNTYFTELLSEKWVPASTKFPDWEVPAEQLVNESATDKDSALMMLPTDMVLVQDEKFRPIVEEYAADQDVFFSDFSRAFSELLELGVNFPDAARE